MHTIYILIIHINIIVHKSNERVDDQYVIAGLINKTCFDISHLSIRDLNRGHLSIVKQNFATLKLLLQPKTTAQERL